MTALVLVGREIFHGF